MWDIIVLNAAGELFRSLAVIGISTKQMLYPLDALHQLRYAAGCLGSGRHQVYRLRGGRDGNHFGRNESHHLGQTRFFGAFTGRPGSKRTQHIFHPMAIQYESPQRR